ncbi:MAG: glycosyl hydrolase family 8 [Fibrobacter sp.]|nr:glycosyl hydrolase family 8 [Fibrobacter sp.]
MKNIFKIALGATLLTSVAVSAAGKYPFPQNMKSPYGYTVPFASTDMIKDHYEAWKGAWYDASKGWILSPEGTCSTVSEAIAYGMLITVYMDDETMFKKLYGTWTGNAPTNGGMHWRIGCSGGTGSATDSDIDAALALVEASVQWNNTQYLDDAKKLISWIETNDFNGTQLKPGSNWNDAFNPSYAGLANFKLFEKVSGGNWGTHRSDVAKDLLACQNSTTGLVTDWCSWGSHQPTKTSAAVAQGEDAGFFDDAARTPWRTAWAYYWYGDEDAKKFNDKVAKWLIPTTMSASGINSGYYWNGEAELSEKRRFVSSTFSGGLGLATSSQADDQNSKNYMETVYKALSQLTSCKAAADCGMEGVKGEKYYPSTLNLLYLLLMTGNMPNLYDLTGFTAFTPDPSLMRSSDSGVDGVQQTRGDTTVGVSGFWNWGAYHDKYGIGTKMSPDSGASPVYLRDGAYFADAVMEIGPEPEYGTPEATAGRYPSAGIAMSFNKAETGIDLSALGIKYLRITAKTEGPVRFAILNEATVQAGGEPGMFIPNTNDYTATTYDLTPCDYGFYGLESRCNTGSEKLIDVLGWVNKNTAPEGREILKSVKGLKFEVKDSKGGYGAISVKSIEFLDGSKNVVDPAKITGIVISTPTVTPGTTDPGTTDPTTPGTTDPGTTPGVDEPIAIAASAPVAMAKVSVSGMNIMVDGVAGASVAVFNMQGKLVASTKAFAGATSITVPNKGLYMVRVGNKMNKVVVK